MPFLIKSLDKRGRIWLDEKSLQAMRWSIWYRGCVQGYLEIFDGTSTIRIHSAEDINVGNTTTQDFVEKLKVMLVMLDRFIQIDTKLDKDFVLRTWLNQSDSHYSGNMSVYLKRITGEPINIGLKISCCNETVAFYPTNARELSRTKKIAKKIKDQIQKMLDVIDAFSSQSI